MGPDPLVAVLWVIAFAVAVDNLIHSWKKWRKES